MRTPLEAMWVIYDDSCGFCCRCANWLQRQSAHFPLTCLPRNGATAKKYFSPLLREGEELLVIGSNGAVYRGPDAFLIALWALRAYRGWANWAKSPAIRNKARSFFVWLSKNRKSLSSYFGMQKGDMLRLVANELAVEEELGSTMGCQTIPTATLVEPSVTPITQVS